MTFFLLYKNTLAFFYTALFQVLRNVTNHYCCIDFSSYFFLPCIMYILGAFSGGVGSCSPLTKSIRYEHPLFRYFLSPFSYLLIVWYPLLGKKTWIYIIYLYVIFFRYYYYKKTIIRLSIIFN